MSEALLNDLVNKINRARDKYNQYIEEIDKMTCLETRYQESTLHARINDDDQLITYMKENLTKRLLEKSSTIIQKTKNKIMDEIDQDKINEMINSLKNINRIYIPNKKKHEKDIATIRKTVKSKQRTDANITTCQKEIPSVRFKERSGSKLKPTPFPYCITNDKIIDKIMNRYKYTVSTNDDHEKEMRRRITRELRNHNEFTIRHWENVLKNGYHKKRNKAFYETVPLKNKKTFLELTDILINVARNDDQKFFNTIHCKINNIFHDMEI